MKQSHIKSCIATLLLALVLLPAFTGCSLAEGLFGGDTSEADLIPEEEETPEYPVTIAGARLMVRPDRVVSLSPALTEKVMDLGLGDQLVGVSRYCGDGIEGVAGKADCGTMLMPDLEQIRSLEPYLVLTSDNLPEEALIQLQQMGVEVAVFNRAERVEELLEVYTGIAILLEGETTGGQLAIAFADSFEARLNDILAATAPYSGDVVVYLRGMPFVMATGDTLEHQLLTRAGMINPAAEQENWVYPPEAAEQAENRQRFEMVSMIFIDQSSVTISDLEQHDYYKTLPAVLQDSYLYIDATAFERQALSMLDELERMAAAVYPESGLASAPGEPQQPDSEADPTDEADSDSSTQGENAQDAA